MGDPNHGSGVDAGSERLDQGQWVSRRRFLAGAAGATLASGMIRPAAAAFAAPSRERRARGSGRAFLTLGREVVGPLKAWHGGEPVGEVDTDGSVSGVVKKHIGDVHYREIVLRCGLSMTDTIYLRIASMLNAVPPLLEGAIVMTDGEGHAKTKLVFHDARIVEVAFPALDAASSAPAFLEVTLAPGATETLPAKGILSSPPQKAWFASKYQILVAGVDTTKVSRVGAFSVRQPVVGGHPSGALEVPDLSVVFAAATAASWNTWAGSFLPGGSTGDAGERTGEIRYLDASLTHVLASVPLSGLGVVTLAPPGFVAGSSAIAKVEATLYCEEMGFIRP